MKRRVIAILCSLLILCLAACAGSEMGSTLNDQTNGFDVTAKNADGSAVNGHITLKKGECLLVNPLLDKGEFQITVYPEGQKDKVLLDETVSGRVFSTYDLEPGEYEIVVTAGKKATGSLSILPGNTEDSRNIIDYVADTFPRGSVLFSLMSQYTPMFSSPSFPELSRPVSSEENDALLHYLKARRLTDGYWQETGSSGREQIPAFDGTGLDFF